MTPINLAKQLSTIRQHWDPHVVADYNDNDVMVVRVLGEYPFHRHMETYDIFLVLNGEIIMDIEGQPSQRVTAGELFIVKAGASHRPRAIAEAHILLIEPKGEPSSGDGPGKPARKPRLDSADE